jgi:hypothetical protein
VAHALLLGSQVFNIVFLGRALKGNTVDDVKPKSFEATIFARIICHQAHGGHAKIHENLSADTVFTTIDREPEFKIGIDRVSAVLLELIRPDLMAKANASSFVSTQIHEDPFAFFGDLVECRMELRTAVTSQ